VSEYGSLVIIEAESGKPSDQLYRHKLPDGTKCQGLLHCYKKGDDWHFVGPDEYEAKKKELPDLCFAFKCPITDIKDKEWPDLEALANDVLEAK
jgi:hypothetical protein